MFLTTVHPSRCSITLAYHDVPYHDVPNHSAVYHDVAYPHATYHDAPYHSATYHERCCSSRRFYVQSTTASLPNHDNSPPLPFPRQRLLDSNARLPSGRRLSSSRLSSKPAWAQKIRLGPARPGETRTRKTKDKRAYFPHRRLIPPPLSRLGETKPPARPNAAKRDAAREQNKRLACTLPTRDERLSVCLSTLAEDTLSVCRPSPSSF